MGNLSILRSAIPGSQVSTLTTGNITLTGAIGAFVPVTITANYLIVAGGGGGGGDYYAGGGGAGGLRSTVTATGGGGTLESAISINMSFP